MSEISQDTIQNAAQGDMGAFEELYRAYSHYVYNVAWRMLTHREDAEEVTQDVFYVVFKNLKNFRFESSFKTWVYRITVNQAINHLKKNSRRQSQAQDDLKDQNLTAAKDDIKESFDKEHRERAIEVLLGTLNSDQRACVVLRNIEGLSYQEIADVLRIPINTVRSRLKRAREIMIALKKEVMENAL